MKAFGKILSVLAISLALAFSLPFAAFADYSEGCLYYIVTNDSITITGCFGDSETLTVPSAIAGYPVNTIAAGAFANNDSLKKVNLPDTVTVVEEGAIGPNVEVVFNANTENPMEYDPAAAVDDTSAAGETAAESTEVSMTESTGSSSASEAQQEGGEADLDISASDDTGFQEGAVLSANAEEDGAQAVTTATAEPSTETSSPISPALIIVAVAVVIGAVAAIAVAMVRKRKSQVSASEEGEVASND